MSIFRSMRRNELRRLHDDASAKTKFNKYSNETSSVSSGNKPSTSAPEVVFFVLAQQELARTDWKMYEAQKTLFSLSCTLHTGTFVVVAWHWKIKAVVSDTKKLLIS